MSCVEPGWLYRISRSACWLGVESAVILIDPNEAGRYERALHISIGPRASRGLLVVCSDIAMEADKPVASLPSHNTLTKCELHAQAVAFGHTATSRRFHTKLWFRRVANSLIDVVVLTSPSRSLTSAPDSNSCLIARHARYLWTGSTQK